MSNVAIAAFESCGYAEGVLLINAPYISVFFTISSLGPPATSMRRGCSQHRSSNNVPSIRTGNFRFRGDRVANDAMRGGGPTTGARR